MTWYAVGGLEPMESDLHLIRKRFSLHLSKKTQINRQRERDGQTDRPTLLGENKIPKIPKDILHILFSGQ